MRRLLQLGTLVLLAATLLVPLFESFDRWDSPGLSNDTEFHLFAIVLFLALLLLVCRRIGTAAACLIAVLIPFLLRKQPLQAALFRAFQCIFHIPPLASPPDRFPLAAVPLRI